MSLACVTFLTTCCVLSKISPVVARQCCCVLLCLVVCCRVLLCVVVRCVLGVGCCVCGCLWLSCGCLVVVLWVSCGCLVVVLWVSCGCLVCVLWVSCLVGVVVVVVVVLTCDYDDVSLHAATRSSTLLWEPCPCGHGSRPCTCVQGPKIPLSFTE